MNTLLIERDEAIAIIRLNRPQALNALNKEVVTELNAALDEIEKDDAVRCVVITGSERAFAAGADIKEMADKSYADVMRDDLFADWGRLPKARKPIIAAVSGFALGGGCELAMMCDFIIAAENAKFGQPEIKLGVIPGMGGSQRLTRAIGKAKAMEMCLTGRMMDAAEAERSGLVARVVPTDKLMEETLATAKTIASYSLPSLMACKDAVNRAFESTLEEGVLFERRTFHALFATDDQKEGMAAFVAKRPPAFKHR
ncbi:MAG: enoyl-CoA hydratase [Hyphomonadaceae bacterium]